MHAPVDNNNYISYITKQIEKSFFIMKNTIIVYATDWCGDCKRSRYYLDQAHIPYQYINIEENEEAMAEVIKINNGFPISKLNFSHNIFLFSSLPFVICFIVNFLSR